MTETPRRRPLAVLALVLGLLAGVVAMHAADGGRHVSHVVTVPAEGHHGAGPAHAQDARDAGGTAGRDAATSVALACLAVLAGLTLALAARSRHLAVLAPLALRSTGRAARLRTRRPPPDLALLCVLRT